MRTALLLLILSLLVACAPSGDSSGELVGPRVSVQGEAKVEVVPDQLAVQFSVTQLADEVADATASVNRRTAAALQAARDAGVAEEDLRALAVTVQPQWDWREGEQLFRGHEATRVVRMKVRDIEVWPALLNALVEAGVDRIDSVEPSHSNQQMIARQALRAAVEDARARADVLADAAGAEVTEVFSIAETGRNYTVAERSESRLQALAAPPPPEDAYEPGTITLTTNVHATFRLRAIR
ncbi:MAG: SIMPL domain-containing protein [Gammaproteobacteria bacterium]